MLELNICNYFNVSPDQILKYREEGESVVIILDLGIMGCPKHTVLLADLLAVAEVETDEELVEGQSEEQEADSWEATDAARKLAERAGINLASIEGTGKDGRIIESDVRKLVANQEEAGQ